MKILTSVVMSLALCGSAQAFTPAHEWALKCQASIPAVPGNFVRINECAIEAFRKFHITDPDLLRALAFTTKMAAEEDRVRRN